ncbi:hypothetical protein BH20ACI3_BH20ACI3_35240 [soil metagenome]
MLRTLLVEVHVLRRLTFDSTLCATHLNVPWDPLASCLLPLASCLGAITLILNSEIKEHCSIPKS